MRKRVLSGCCMLCRCSHDVNKQSLILLLVSLLHGRHACCYRSIVVLSSRESHLLFQRVFFWFWRRSQYKSTMRSLSWSVRQMAGYSKGLVVCYWQYLWLIEETVMGCCAWDMSYTVLFCHTIHFRSTFFRDSWLYDMGKPFCYHNGGKSGDGCSIQWTRTLFCLWTVKYRIWPWICWSDMGRLGWFWYFRCNTFLGRTPYLVITMVLWYMLAFAVDRIPRCSSCRLQGRRLRKGWISSTKIRG